MGPLPSFLSGIVNILFPFKIQDGDRMSTTSSPGCSDRERGFLGELTFQLYSIMTNYSEWFLWSAGAGRIP